ncbi:H-type lectin domain protein [Tritonibacter multivorans]|uniref:H-type lectin domain protein n=2 Tax=Tritonibacter multivorans TaxID=928856 RepID=A0A0N7LZB5_9RHOB|nr:H-type lectin domain-containing protein [Tritonibacter multivorans]MDA7422671.1 H-type lectin domain-containing protein [Tritonibacter multivorans]CUH77201.1 H-type lectin domain protein [Tritonibacter multivorans]SFD52312.1 H-type lectin domain-containing protein [Tritonibacter multivorans]
MEEKEKPQMFMRLSGPRTAISQGDVEVFSEFEEGGEMWTGAGGRERRIHVTFDNAYSAPPAVFVSPSLMDMHNEGAYRAELVAEDITCAGFDVVFRTWSDSRVARVRAAWMAMGEMAYEDDWNID